MEFIVHDNFLRKEMFFFLYPVFDIQLGKSQTTKASFTYQKPLCYEAVAENIHSIPQLFWTYF